LQRLDCACNLRSEGIRVPLEDFRDCLLPDRLILDVVAAPIAIAVLAVLPAGETLAVELEAARVLAVAVLLCGRLLRSTADRRVELLLLIYQLVKRGLRLVMLLCH